MLPDAVVKKHIYKMHRNTKI